MYGLDAKALEQLASEDAPDTVKVFNLRKALEQIARQTGASQPYLIPIGERAEKVAQAFEDRQLSTQQALEELQKLIREVHQAEEERKEKDLSPEGFAVYWLLHREGVENAQAVGRETAAAFEQYPHWQQSAEQEREVKKSLYKTLINAKVTSVVDVANRIMQMLRHGSR